MDCTEAYKEHIEYTFNAFCRVVIYYAKGVERIHDVFPVCFCASHRNFPLSPTWGGAWFIVAILYCSLS